MSTTNIVEYETVQIGAGPLVRSLLKELRVASAIDSSINAQPEVATTYGHLLQVIIVNRLSFSPQPLYRIGQWASEHGIADLFEINPAWLDDDRLGAGLDAIADHSVEIWVKIIKRMRQRYKLPFNELHGDTTSIYFEGDFSGSDEARAKTEATSGTKSESKSSGPNEKKTRHPIPKLEIGYNKDGQRDKKQMVVSLLNVGRVPIWFSPWNGSQSDDGVCLDDLKQLRQQMSLPGNTLLIGDSKICQQATMIECCQSGLQFLAPHPWTPTAKDVWRQTSLELESGQLEWQMIDYVSQNNSKKPEQKRPKHRICEVSYLLKSKKGQETFKLRWLFRHSTSLAEASLKKREKALTAGEAAMTRLAGLVGKYHYRERSFIIRQMDEQLRRARAQAFFTYTLTGTDGERDWKLSWKRNDEAIKDDAIFDGITILCTNASPEELPPQIVQQKYKEQIGVEQTIDFIKSPVQIRPLWLHQAKRIVGLTLLIMIAVLIAMLLEFEVRRLLKEKSKKIEGLRPEGRKDPAPTAKSLLRAFSDYAYVVVKYADGNKEIHYPKFKPVPQQIWDLLQLPPLPG